MGVTLRRVAGWLPTHTVQGTLLLLLLVVLVPILAAEGAIYFTRLDTRRGEELRANLEVARTVSAVFDAHVQDLVRHEGTIEAILALSIPLPPADVLRLLDVSAGAYPTVRHFTMADPSGGVTATTEPEPLVSIARQPYFQEIVAGREWVVSDLFRRGESGDVIFTIARGVHDDAGHLRSVVVAVVDPTRLGIVLPIARAEEGTISILDSQGRLVYRRPEAPLSWEQRSAAEENANVPRVVQGEEVTGEYRSVVDGRDYIGGLTPIRSIGWAAGASRPVEVVMGPIAERNLRQLGIALLVGVAGFALAVVLSRHISVPIGRLREGVLALGRGEERRPIGVGGPVEVQELAGAFNRMSAEIRGREVQQERLLEEVRRRAAELDTIISSIADGVVIYGPNGEILRKNHAADRMIPYTPEEWRLSIRERLALRRVEMPDGEPIRPDELPAARALRGETVLGVLQIIHAPDGSTRWASNSAAPIRDPDGASIGAVSVFTDVTALHDLQQEREDLLHTVSHDLRAPLTVIMAQAQIIERATGRVDLVEKGAEAIHTAARRMNVMIQDLVDAARLESGQLQPSVRPLELRPYVLDLLERLESLMETGRIRVEAPEDLPPVHADPDRLERILTNLLSNALKYSDPGTEVVLRLAAADSEVVTSVADRGRGIRPEELPHLFERFRRTQDARERREGLGLGLYITRGLVEAHGGRIWVESRVGVGSTFHFTLPMG